MLIPSTITALRTRRYTSTLYIRCTTRRLDFEPMDGGGRSDLQPPFVSDYPPTWPNISPPLTVVKSFCNSAHSDKHSHPHGGWPEYRNALDLPRFGRVSVLHLQLVADTPARSTSLVLIQEGGEPDVDIVARTGSSNDHPVGGVGFQRETGGGVRPGSHVQVVVRGRQGERVQGSPRFAAIVGVYFHGRPRPA